MAPAKTTNATRIAVALAGVAVAALSFIYFFFNDGSIFSFGLSTKDANAEGVAKPAGGASGDAFRLNLSDSQLAAVKVEPVEEHEFPVEKEAVGSIDFNEDMETQVFTPYQGKIVALFAAIGNDVKKGQTLFTIDSPDLLAAEFELNCRRRRHGADHP